MEGKEELLKLAFKELDQAAKLLKAAGEELLAEEAEALSREGGTSPRRLYALPLTEATLVDQFREPPPPAVVQSGRSGQGVP